MLATTDKQLWQNTLTRLKAKCIQDNIAFALTINDVMSLDQPITCPLTGLTIERTAAKTGSGGNPAAPTIMMIDRSAGYCEGNIMIVSNLAATIRHTLTDKQLRLLCKRMPQMIDIA